jgi:hypothetical protein
VSEERASWAWAYYEESKDAAVLRRVSKIQASMFVFLELEDSLVDSQSSPLRSADFSYRYVVV